MTEFRLTRERIPMLESRKWDLVRSPNATEWRRVRRLTPAARKYVDTWLAKRHRGLVCKRIDGYYMALPEDR